jgi:GT2 family glycosyltransferase
VPERSAADIVVLTYNGSELLPTALEAILGQRYEPVSITVVDNGSTDGSAELVRRRWPSVKLVQLPHNVGVAAGLNRGLEAGDAPFVALVNDDVQLDPDWLGELVGALEAHPGAASATGKMLSFSRPELIDGAGDLLAWSGAALRRGRGERDEGQYDAPEATFYACGAATLYRREVFSRIGSFDEDLWAYYEDVDWGFRAQLMGYGCRYVPTALAYHVGSATTDRDRAFYLTLQRRNLITFVVKNYPASSLARHGHRVLALCLAQALASVRDGVGRAHLRGWSEALGTLPRTLRKRRMIQATRVAGADRLEDFLVDDWGFDPREGPRLAASLGRRALRSSRRFSRRRGARERPERS